MIAPANLALGLVDKVTQFRFANAHTETDVAADRGWIWVVAEIDNYLQLLPGSHRSRCERYVSLSPVSLWTEWSSV